MKLLIRINIYVIIALLVASMIASCGSSSERKIPSIEGQWIVLSRVIEFNEDDFDSTDQKALAGLNSYFSKWIADGQIILTFDPLKLTSYSEALYDDVNDDWSLNRKFEGVYSQDYANNVISVQYTNQNQLGTWSYTSNIASLDQNFVYMKQTLDNLALKNYWIIYGNGHRDFREDATAVMVTSAYKVNK